MISDSALPDGQGWWYARFLFSSSEGDKPDWSLGTFVGGEVVTPLLAQYRADIPLWRVYRRANRNGGGHVFSLIFYSTASVAQQVYHSIETNLKVSYLKENSLLDQVTYDDPTLIQKPNIRDTSDLSWPLSIQKSWPTYAMGASQMWLDLANDIKTKHIDDGNIEDRYKMTQDELTAIWEQQAQHAFLHHLNAIFAYQPILIRH